MKTVVIYESMFGNTRDIARATAEGLAEWSDVSLTDVDSALLTVPTDVALVVAGGPTHAFSMSRQATRYDAVSRGAVRASSRGLREWLGAVSVTTPVSLATFDTHTKQRWVPGSPGSDRASARSSQGRLRRRRQGRLREMQERRGRREETAEERGRQEVARLPREPLLN